MAEVIEHKARNMTMDIMKGLGITYVVLGHTHVNPMHDFVYLFHMPLFYFVSGYFYNDDYTNKPIALFKNRLKTLYIPFLKYEIIFLLLHNIFFKLNIYSELVTSDFGIVSPYSPADFIINLFRILTFGGTEQLLGALWFFTVLFTVNVLFFLTRYIIRNMFKVKCEVIVACVVGAMYLAGIILSHYAIPVKRNLDISLVAIMTYYLGFLYKKIELKVPMNPMIAIACVALLCLGTLYGKTGYLSPVYIKPAIYLLFALSGIYANLYISKRISHKQVSILFFMGRNTIIIMALHFLCFKLVNLTQVYWNNYPIHYLAKFPVLYAYDGWWVLYATAGLLIPLLLKRMITAAQSLITGNELVRG